MEYAEFWFSSLTVDRAREREREGQACLRIRNAATDGVFQCAEHFPARILRMRHVGPN